MKDIQYHCKCTFPKHLIGQIHHLNNVCLFYKNFTVTLSTFSRTMNLHSITELFTVALLPRMFNYIFKKLHSNTEKCSQFYDEPWSFRILNTFCDPAFYTDELILHIQPNPQWNPLLHTSEHTLRARVSTHAHRGKAPCLRVVSVATCLLLESNWQVTQFSNHQATSDLDLATP